MIFFLSFLAFVSAITPDSSGTKTLHPGFNESSFLEVEMQARENGINHMCPGVPVGAAITHWEIVFQPQPCTATLVNPVTLQKVLIGSNVKSSLFMNTASANPNTHCQVAKCFGRLYFQCGTMAGGNLVVNGQAILLRTDVAPLNVIAGNGFPIYYTKPGTNGGESEEFFNSITIVFSTPQNQQAFLTVLTNYWYNPLNNIPRPDNLDIGTIFGDVLGESVVMTAAGMRPQNYPEWAHSKRQQKNQLTLRDALPADPQPGFRDFTKGRTDKKLFEHKVTKDVTYQTSTGSTATLIPANTMVFIKRMFLDPAIPEIKAKALIELDVYKALQYRGGHYNAIKMFGYWYCTRPTNPNNQPEISYVLELAGPSASDFIRIAHSNLIVGSAVQVAGVPEWQTIKQKWITGLSFLQETGYMHGDLKPDNILVDYRKYSNGLSGFVGLIFDFDTARLLLWQAQITNLGTQLESGDECVPPERLIVMSYPRPFPQKGVALPAGAVVNFLNAFSAAFDPAVGLAVGTTRNLFTNVHGRVLSLESITVYQIGYCLMALNLPLTKTFPHVTELPAKLVALGAGAAPQWPAVRPYPGPVPDGISNWLNTFATTGATVGVPANFANVEFELAISRVISLIVDQMIVLGALPATATSLARSLRLMHIDPAQRPTFAQVLADINAGNL